MGFEVAGVVLGVLPIVFKAVELSEDGIKTGRLLFRKQAYVKKLALAVLFQQQTLAETVRSLLIQSGCEDFSRLDNDPVGYLNDESVRNQVMDYLGPENDMAFSGALKQSDNIVRKIARNIGSLVLTVKQQDPTDDLLVIIKANQNVDGIGADLTPRVKLMLGASDIKSAIKGLDDTTNTLYRFTRIVLSNRQPVENISSRKALKPARALRRVQGFAGNLHSALSQG